ncbi:hypothetical protein GCM10028802_29000 [Terrabacter terrigena]
MPALTARSTVAAGVLVSHTHMARVSVGDEAVTVGLAPVVDVRGFDAAAAPGATASAAAATPTATSTEPAARARTWRGRRRMRGVAGM